jgi:hypothetical protein
MPSHVHEALVELFRARPGLAVELLAGLVALPEHGRASLESGDLTELAPTEYRADAVVVLRGPGDRALWALVVEAQLRRDPDKRWSWPAYVATLRARLRCPVTLLVVCPDRSVAAWCAVPIELGGPGTALGQVVIGPDRIPVIVDGGKAAAAPELAVLGAIAHGSTDFAVLDALLGAFDVLDEDRAALYCDIVLDALPAAARDHLEALVTTGTHEYRSDFARGYFAQGKAEGKAEGILTVLRVRGVDVPEDVRATITGCTDLDRLDSWMQRAATAATAQDLFTDS